MQPKKVTVYKANEPVSTYYGNPPHVGTTIRANGEKLIVKRVWVDRNTVQVLAGFHD